MKIWLRQCTFPLNSYQVSCVFKSVNINDNSDFMVQVCHYRKLYEANVSICTLQRVYHITNTFKWLGFKL